LATAIWSRCRARALTHIKGSQLRYESHAGRLDRSFLPDPKLKARSLRIRAQFDKRLLTRAEDSPDQIVIEPSIPDFFDVQANFASRDTEQDQIA